MLNLPNLIKSLDIQDGSIEGFNPQARHLSELKGSFADQEAFEQALRQGDPLVYWVTNIEFPGEGGELSYAMAKIMPGKVGREYFLTKGHFHAWRPASEVYIGLQGEGYLVLESEDGQECRSFRLLPFTAVYVPGHTAHRTVNVGDIPLTYLGVYPSQAGHDYGAIARTNFRHVLVEVDGQPVLMERSQFIQQYLHSVPAGKVQP